MTVCSVATCGNHYQKTKGQNVVYHRFPKDPKLQKIWITRCRQRGSLVNPAHARICSKHFTAEDYERDLRNELLGIPVRIFLKKDAIPTQCLSKKTTKASKKGTSETPPTTDGPRETQLHYTVPVVSSREKRNKARNIRKRCLETLRSLQSKKDTDKQTDADKPSNADKQTDTDGLCDPDKEKLKQHILHLKNQIVQVIRKKKNDLSELRGALMERIFKLKKQVAEYSKQEVCTIKKHAVMTANLYKVFTAKQIHALRNGTRARWDDATIEKALGIYRVIARKGYIYLRKSGYPYPSISTLKRFRRKTRALAVQPQFVNEPLPDEGSTKAVTVEPQCENALLCEEAVMQCEILESWNPSPSDVVQVVLNCNTN